MKIKNQLYTLIFLVFLNFLPGQEYFIPLELGNHWTYDYTFEIESVTGELQDFISTVNEYQEVISLDLINDMYAYKINTWQEDSSWVSSEWFTQDDSGLFSIASLNWHDSSRSQFHFKYHNKSFTSFKKLYSLLIDSVSGDTSLYDPPRTILKYPLVDSIYWVWFDDPWYAVRTVEEYEVLETMAGIFECKRIRIDYDLEDDIVFYDWWSPNIGLIKRDISIYGLIHTNENSDSLGIFNSYMTWELKDINFLDIVTESIVSANSFEVYSAYPNPFNPSTTISYRLPVSSFVNISIYNLYGRLVESLVNEEKQSGYHFATWNANNFSSGVYLYRVSGGAYSLWGKCLLIK